MFISDCTYTFLRVNLHRMDNRKNHVCMSFFVQHPYIYKVTFATASESSALVIRPFNEKGTLKDLIYKVLYGVLLGHTISFLACLLIMVSQNILLLCICIY